MWNTKHYSEYIGTWRSFQLSVSESAYAGRYQTARKSRRSRLFNEKAVHRRIALNVRENKPFFELRTTHFQVIIWGKKELTERNGTTGKIFDKPKETQLSRSRFYLILKTVRTRLLIFAPNFCAQFEFEGHCTLRSWMRELFWKADYKKCCSAQSMSERLPSAPLEVIICAFREAFKSCQKYF